MAKGGCAGVCDGDLTRLSKESFKACVTGCLWIGAAPIV
jgi:hypothetical protein